MPDASTQTAAQRSESDPAEGDNPPVTETIPAPEDLSESAPDLGRIGWGVITLALLVAMVALGIRGDIGYAAVTLAVAAAAAINLF